MCSLFVAVVNYRFLPWSVVLLDSPAEDQCGLSQDPSTLAMIISFCVIISRRRGNLRTSNSLVSTGREPTLNALCQALRWCALFYFCCCLCPFLIFIFLLKYH